MAARRRFVVILSIIFALYAALQVFFVQRTQAGLALSPPAVAALAVWAALMTAMPLLEQRLEHRGWFRLGRAAAWAGYTWMGLSFLFFWISVALFLAAAVVRWAGGGGPDTHGWYLLACAATGLVAVYGFISARILPIERVRLTTPKLPPGSRPLRIAVIADVHLGALVQRRRLASILRRVEAAQPDILVSAGDLVDGQAFHVDDLAPMLADYRPPGGKYAVTGNHEYFIGVDHALEFHRRAGFTMLRGRSVAVGDALTIAGVDDPTGRDFDPRTVTDEPSTLAGCPPERYTILLKHQPRIDPRAAGLFDLQLSGHVHKGQVFPFVLLVRLFYPLGTGLKRAGEAAWLYVSRGTGTWGPPMRVGARPEVTLIEIAPAG